MKTSKHTIDINGMKTIPFQHLVSKLLIIIVVGCLFFNGCLAALQEAQQLREKREKEKRDKEYVTLAPSKGEIKVDKDAHTSESDHYKIALADDLKNDEEFGDTLKRNEFMSSALVYMESLYNELHERFGFEPEYKIHVKIYKNYHNNMRADTQKQYVHSNQGKTLKSIGMNFPLSMYKDPGVRAHELTHAFTSAYFLPTWFDEGIAVKIQTEFAKSGAHPKFDDLQKNLKRNLDGVNSLEDWETGGNQELTQWRYSYAYTIIAELQKLYGEDFYIKAFELMEVDQLHNKLPSRMSTSFLVYYLSQAAGADLVPFFKKIHFNVRKLTKEEILQNINR